MSDEAEVRIFPFRITGTSNAANHRTVLAQMLGVGAEGDDQNSEPVSDSEVWTPIGFASRPSIPSSGSKVTGLAIQVGDAIHVLHVRDKSLATLGDSDLAAGDAIMYAPGAPGTTLKLAANGDMTATVKSGQVFTVNCNNATITIDANGAITVKPASGQTLSLGGDSGSTQFVMNGSDLRTYLSSLETAINNLRNDMTTISTHSHPASSGTTSPSTTLTTIPTGSSAADPPSQSTITKTI